MDAKSYINHVGAEIQVRVKKRNVKNHTKDKENVQHSLYEFSRSLGDGITLEQAAKDALLNKDDREKLANNFFYTLGKFYIKISKFRKRDLES